MMTTIYDAYSVFAGRQACNWRQEHGNFVGSLSFGVFSLNFDLSTTSASLRVRDCEIEFSVRVEAFLKYLIEHSFRQAGFCCRDLASH